MASAGTRVGPYELLAPIGAGGMGEVWSALDTRLNRQVAIKFSAARFSERFEREARAVAALNHPHICTLYDVGPDYLVMELVEGQPLRGPMPLDRARSYAAQILSALDAAHRKGITHRDLKPANILIGSQGVKLVDFGLAKLREGPNVVAPDQEKTIAMTGVNTVLGTIPYMSPEQAMGKAADARSDIFSFGLVLYEMITGTRAFDGPNPASVTAAIVEREAPSIRDVATPSFDRVLQKCLAKDPDDRWQSARDLRTALEWSGETSRATAPAIVRRWPWIAGVVVALSISALLGWLGGRTRAPVSPARALSLQIPPPPGAEFDLSVLGGGSAISRDGAHVAFVATTDGASTLWVRSLDSVTPRQLPDTEGASLPFWSPDGRALGYFANGYLRRIEVSGGASTALAPVAFPAGGGTWIGDDTIVFNGGVGPLHRIAASGGTPSPLTTVAANEFSHRLPRILADGRTIIFFGQGEEPGVYLTTLDRPEVKRRVVASLHDAVYIPELAGEPAHIVRVQGDGLIAQPFDLASVRFTGPAVSIPGAGNVATNPGGNRSYLSVADDGTILYTAGTSRYQLTWFGADGKALATVGPPDRYVGLRLSPNGAETLAIVGDEMGARDVWRVELARNVRSRLTADNQGNFAIWSPDGQRIVFTGGTNQTLLERAIGETASPRTLHRAGPMFPYDWSANGRLLLFTAFIPAGQLKLWTLPMDGSGPAAPLLGSVASEFHGQFSPDGRWIAFASDESGRVEVYIQAFPGGGARRLVSAGGGSNPRWGDKGAALYYRSSTGELVTVPVRFDGPSVALGAPRIVMRLPEPPSSVMYPYDVAADGRILALAPASGESAASSLTVLVNWRAALRR